MKQFDKDTGNDNATYLIQGYLSEEEMDLRRFDEYGDPISSPVYLVNYDADIGLEISSEDAAKELVKVLQEAISEGWWNE